MISQYKTYAGAAQHLLYAGEQFDNDAQQYYLRARYYDPLNGRFNRTDPYAGSPQDPQSLQKYLYCHANPVNRVDPSGLMSFSLTGLTVSMAIGAVVGGLVGGAITKSWKGVIYGAIIGAILAGAIYTVIAYWPQIIKWFKDVINVWRADRTVSNGLYDKLLKAFGENATRAQKIQFFSRYKWYRLIGEGFVGYAQKVWQLLTLDFTGLGKWFTPTLFDGIVGGGIVAVVILVWVYKDDIQQLFIALKQPAAPNRTFILN